MNVKLQNVVVSAPSSKEGEAEMTKCDECFIRGNNIQAIQFDEDVIRQHTEEIKRRQAEQLESKRKKDELRKAVRKQEIEDLKKNAKQ
mmetsp:Transcript_5250/g.8871  ORF Transcript_5250/g.8871 Transcript_5250/m.8871 type:complete len:88 (-) Transcript_5250:598-861(-)